eukprot:TRINITY_DN8251_c0_g1_i4.p1 TRINITY_DN8251_c0_g1~~TRINITY_DN8251_c0_g1_i4.p1  ORF type:complete len:223 (-),score=43.85 TRINITY_DN8251_c0_g1_i4:318-986(-)
MKYSTEQLAKLVAADARQLTEKAQELGVGAYLSKPIHRERLNERFIQNTLKNVEFANRSLDESVMAGCRQKQKQLDEGRKQQRRGDKIDSPPRKRIRLDYNNEEASNQKRCLISNNDKIEDDQVLSKLNKTKVSNGDEIDDEEVLNILRKTKVRGRGGIGSRANEPGPFKFEAQNEALLKEDRFLMRQLGPLMQEDTSIQICKSGKKKDKKKSKKKKKRERD